MQQAGVVTAWLTLDEADNDAPRFELALAQVVGQLTPKEPVPVGMTEVLERLSGMAKPFVLMLDDVEQVRDPGVLGLVKEIIEQLPRQGRLFVASRSVPDLGLGRLRARGELEEVDTQVLRFTEQQAGEFLQLRTGTALAASQVMRLRDKTEGWAAALWLVALALQRQSGSQDELIERFSGTSTALAEYLAQDVLAHQPAEVRQFLLRCSVLRQLTAPLCRALNAKVDCEQMLERLHTENLFLVPLSGVERAYRLHSLFADFLRAQLVREHPHELARLHLAASGWYESQDRLVPAIDHAIAGEDYPYALSMLERHGEGLLEQGRLRLLYRWFRQMPAHEVASRPQVQVVSLWATCFTKGPQEATAELEASGCERSDDPVVQVHLNALRPLLLGMADRPLVAVDEGLRSLSRLPSGKPFADAVLSNFMAHLMLAVGRYREARVLLDKGRDGGAHSAFNRMYAESVEGLLDLEEGRLQQAAARFRTALHAAEGVGHYRDGNPWVGLLHALTLYETDEWASLGGLVKRHLPNAHTIGLPDHTVIGYRMVARMAFVRGDIQEASQALSDLEYFGHHRRLPRVVALAKLERARWLLFQKNAAAAKAELDRADDPGLWSEIRPLHMLANDIEYMAVARARWEIAFGDPRSALARLDAEVLEAQAGGRVRRLYKLRLLQAAAWWRAGETTQAETLFEETLRSTGREGFFRLVLDEAPLIAPLLRRCAERIGVSCSSDPLFTEYVLRLAAGLGDADVEYAAEVLPAADRLRPLESLTAKEMGVLRLVAEGYSNLAIAQKLFVSESTVRTHLRSINSKLGASTRTQAVALARRCQLLN